MQKHIAAYKCGSGLFSPAISYYQSYWQSRMKPVRELVCGMQMFTVLFLLLIRGGDTTISGAAKQEGNEGADSSRC